jgi:hypothetical protein
MFIIQIGMQVEKWTQLFSKCRNWMKIVIDLTDDFVLMHQTDYDGTFSSQK